MKGGSSAKGFTIVETLIVLAVTGALFISAMTLVGGQQAKTEFAQSVRELESKIRDISNDVATGTYDVPGKYDCNAPEAGGDIIPTPGGTNPLGSNKDCMFVGRVVQPGYEYPTGSGKNILRIYTVAGRRLQGGGGDVLNLSQARPQSLGTGSYIDTKLDGGLTVGRVSYDYGSAPGGTGDMPAFGFFTTFPSAATGSSGLTSGTNTTDIYPLVIPVPADTSTVEQAIKNFASAVPGKNPKIIICVNSGGTNQHADITLGGTEGNGQLATRLDILSGACV